MRLTSASRNVLVRGKDSDIGHILENIVYLELLRRGFQVRVGQMNDGEVDFVAMNSEETYYQVNWLRPRWRNQLWNGNWRLSGRFRILPQIPSDPG